MKEKRIYIIKDLKNKQLEKQLCWIDNEIKEISSYLFNKDQLECKQYEVYNAKFIDQSTHKEYILKAIIMRSSGANEKNVLVCPLINVKMKELTTNGFILGKLQSINDENTYYAKISSLRCIPKEAFKIYSDDLLSSIKPIGHITTEQFISILTNYKNYIETILRVNTKIEFLDDIYQIEYAC